MCIMGRRKQLYFVIAPERRVRIAGGELQRQIAAQHNLAIALGGSREIVDGELPAVGGVKGQSGGHCSEDSSSGGKQFRFLVTVRL